MGTLGITASQKGKHITDTFKLNKQRIRHVRKDYNHTTHIVDIDYNHQAESTPRYRERTKSYNIHSQGPTHEKQRYLLRIRPQNSIPVQWTNSDQYLKVHVVKEPGETHKKEKYNKGKKQYI